MGGGSRLENDDPEKKEDVENDEGDTGVEEIYSDFLN